MCSGLRRDRPRSNILTSPPCSTHPAALPDPVGQPIFEFFRAHVIHDARIAVLHDLERPTHIEFEFVVKRPPVSDLLPKLLDVGFLPATICEVNDFRRGSSPSLKRRLQGSWGRTYAAVAFHGNHICWFDMS